MTWVGTLSTVEAGTVMDEQEAADIQSVLNECAAVAMLDVRGRIISVNERFCELLQRRRDELIGHDYGSLSAGRQSAQFYSEIEQVAGRGAVWRGELDFRSGDGRTRWTSTTVIPRLNARNVPVRFVVVCIDMTEHRRTMEDFEKVMRFHRLLTDLSARFLALPSAQIDSAIEITQRMIVEALDLDRSALWHCSEQGILMVLTHSWQRSGFGAYLPADVSVDTQFPWTIGRLLKGEMVCFSHVDELPPDAATDAAMYRRFGTHSFIGFPLTADGRTFGALTFSTLAARQKWGNDIVSGLKLVTQIIGSVVSRQRAETREEQLREELAHAMRVASMGEVTAALAHELNQPLAAILANAQAARNFLADGVVDCGELRDILDDIVRDDKRAGSVIHSLRAMIRKCPAEREPCCINALVNEVIELLRGEMVAEKIEVHPAFAATPPRILVARVEMQQVLVNLFMNAIQAMQLVPPHHRSIEVTTRMEKEEVVLTIRDRGPGMPAERLDSIFQPFFSTKRNGLGMGLSICRRIVESHGGRIEARNHECGGASFRITLPARMPR